MKDCTAVSEEMKISEALYSLYIHVFVSVDVKVLLFLTLQEQLNLKEIETV